MKTHGEFTVIPLSRKFSFCTLTKVKWISFLQFHRLLNSHIVTSGEINGKDGSPLMLKTDSKMIHIFIATLQLLHVRCVPALYYPEKEKDKKTL